MDGFARLGALTIALIFCLAFASAAYAGETVPVPVNDQSAYVDSNGVLVWTGGTANGESGTSPDDAVTFTQSSEDANTVTVTTTSAGNIDLPDPDDNGYCTYPDEAPSPTVTCTNVSSVQADAEEGNDTVDASGLSTLPSTLNADANDEDAGVDTLTGGGVGDTLNSSAGNDTQNGGPGDDSLNGGSGDDTLNGDAGDDYADGGAGNDMIDGGADPDGNAFLAYCCGYTETGLHGGEGNDTINGGDGGDFITGDDGNDTLNGDADTDYVYGGNGNDTIDGGTGDDTFTAYCIPFCTFKMSSLSQADELPPGYFGGLFGGPGDDTIHGGDGSDLIGGQESPFNKGGADSDASDKDTLFGDAGNDQMDGGDDDDVMDGGDGIDDMYGDDGNDTVSGGAGDDAPHYDYSDDLCCIQSDDGGIYGGNGNDRLDGGDGVDYLDGGAGDDVETGGAGDDAYSGSIPCTGSTTTGNSDCYTQISGGILGGDDNDTLYGDTLDGGNGRDYIYGGNGNDTIYGQGGDDSYHGFAGPTVQGQGFGTGYPGLYGGDGDDTISGGDGGDFVEGDNGADVLNGDNGDDEVQEYEDGSTDVAHGDAGVDTIHYSSNTQSGNGAATITLNDVADDGIAPDPDNGDDAGDPGNNFGSDFENATFSTWCSADNCSAAESTQAGSDATIVGTAGPNQLFGGAGNDDITGGDGADYLSGGAGDDTFHARDGFPDFVDCDAGTDTAVVDQFDTVQNCENVDEADVKSAYDTSQPPPVPPVPASGSSETPHDTTAPKTTLTVTGGGDVSGNQLVLGLRVSALCNEDCKLSLRLLAQQEPGTATFSRDKGYNVVVGRRTVGFGKSKRNIRVRPCERKSGGPQSKACLKRFERALNARLKKSGKVTMKLFVVTTDRAGNRTQKIKTVVIRRKRK